MLILYCSNLRTIVAIILFQLISGIVFRSSHSLSIKTGRYHHIDRNNRICSLCNMNMLEDEYHFVLVCPFYSTIRDKYIKPSTFKLTQLMSTDSSKHLIKLCKYLTTATMHRSDNIVTWLLLTSNIINITNITHLLLTFVETIIFTISRNVHIVLFIYILYLCMPTKCKFVGK